MMVNITTTKHLEIQFLCFYAVGWYLSKTLEHTLLYNALEGIVRGFLV